MNFKLKLTKLDIIVIVFVAIASLILSFSVYYLPKGNGSHATIYVMGKNELSLPLGTDKKINIQLSEGEYEKIIKTNENNDEIFYLGYFPSIEEEMKIEVYNNKIRVSYTKCPARVCINQGWVSTPNVPITCTHNRVVAVIESIVDSDIDIIL